MALLGFCCAPLMLGVPAAWASKTQAAPDWGVQAAKTPTPPDAKDAPAVLLFDEYLITVDAQNRAVEQERYAVRILKPQGRKYADCMVSYDVDEKLNYFHSWTITADARQFQAGDKDFTDYGAYDSPILQMTERIRTLKPPASDPGSVVICETEKHLRPYMTEKLWQIQHEIPVVEEALELALPAAGHFAAAWHRYPEVKPIESGSSHIRWEIKDVPALDLENVDAAPDWGALAARASIQWGEAAVSDPEKQWHAIGLWQDQLEGHRHDPTPEIAAKAEELAAGAPDLYAKLSRITSYLQKNIRYFVVEMGIGGWQPHYAADIYRNGYGDCKDKATLLIAMLKAIGVPARSLSVDTSRGFIDPAAPSRFGDHMVVAIELPDGVNDPRLMARVKAANGKTMLIFDPTDEDTPVGLLRADLQGGWGYLADDADSQILQMPVLPPDSAGLTLQGTFTLSANGAIAGSITETLTGDDARYWRLSIKRSDTQELRERLERRLGSDLPGVAFKGYEFKQIADLDKPLSLDLQLSTANYTHAAGPLMLLRPRVMGSVAREVPDVMQDTTRSYPIEIGHPGLWRASFDIAIPPGYVVDETPDPVNLNLGFASYRSEVSAKGNSLHYEREYVVRQVEIPASKAAAFRQLESAIFADEKGSVVLKRQ